MSLSGPQIFVLVNLTFRHWIDTCELSNPQTSSCRVSISAGNGEATDTAFATVWLIAAQGYIVLHLLRPRRRPEAKGGLVSALVDFRL